MLFKVAEKGHWFYVPVVIEPGNGEAMAGAT